MRPSAPKSEMSVALGEFLGCVSGGWTSGTSGLGGGIYDVCVGIVDAFVRSLHFLLEDQVS